MTATTLEENALHTAAVNYARAQVQPLEVRVRIDLALRILAEERHRTTGEIVLDEDGLEAAERLAQLTLLHAGEIGRSKPTKKPTHVEALLLRARLVVRNAQGHFSDGDQTLRAAIGAFNELVGMLSTCSRMAGDPPCTNYGDCPEHGKNREGVGSREYGVGSESGNPTGLFPTPHSATARDERGSSE